MLLIYYIAQYLTKVTDIPKYCYSMIPYQIRWKLPVWSHLLKNFFMENFIFCAVRHDMKSLSSFPNSLKADLASLRNYIASCPLEINFTEIKILDLDTKCFFIPIFRYSEGEMQSTSWKNLYDMIVWLNKRKPNSSYKQQNLKTPKT